MCAYLQYTPLPTLAHTVCHRNHTQHLASSFQLKTTDFVGRTYAPNVGSVPQAKQKNRSKEGTAISASAMPADISAGKCSDSRELEPKFLIFK